MTRPFRPFALAVFFAGAAISAHAQITFTIAAHANSSAAGYLIGDSVVFAYTTAASLPDNVDSQFVLGDTRWREETLSEAQFIIAVTGTLVTGNYVRPITDVEDPFSY